MQRFRREHLLRRPLGYRVRTKIVGKHRLLFAVPPGRRKKGAAKLMEVLHPLRENPSRCGIAQMNPMELLIFGNPSRAEKIRAARERAEKIRETAGQFKRGNPESEARDLYEDFHQAPAEEILVGDETQDMPRHTAVLGDLVALGFGTRAADGEDLHGDELAVRWKECSHVSFDGGDVKLAADPRGGQLYFVGGDQSLRDSDRQSLGAEESDGRYLLGPARFIVYNARKADYGGEYDGYCHEFGEEGGRRPSAYYDARRERVLLRGGSYRVEGRGIID